MRSPVLLAAVIAGVSATSSKMDFLPLGDVRTDMVTNPLGISPHVHTFYGAAASLRPDTSYAEIRAACGNSGNVDDNKSLYWHPTIYKFDNSDGLYYTVPISFMSAYYVWRTKQTTAFPDGFQMIARQTAGGKARVKFDCSGPSACERSDGCAVPEGSECKPDLTLYDQEEFSKGHSCFPEMQCSELEIKIVFPSCWDGESLTSSDFMSHVAYTEGDWDQKKIDHQQQDAVDAECPASHPVRIPEVQVYFRIVGYEGGHHVFSDGTSTVHADYFSGWNATELQRVLDECENESEAASSNAWCEDFLSFRDTPKLEGDERIVEKLEAVQPSPALDLRGTVCAEPITGVRFLPGRDPNAPIATLIPVDPNTDWHCTQNCTLLGNSTGDRSGTCGIVDGGGGGGGGEAPSVPETGDGDVVVPIAAPVVAPTASPVPAANDDDTPTDPEAGDDDVVAPSAAPVAVADDDEISADPPTSAAGLPAVLARSALVACALSLAVRWFF